MNKLIRLAVKNQSLTFFTVFIILVVGIQTFLSLPQNEDPQLEIRVVQIVTYWPGATPEDVELYVTKPIEESVSKQDDVNEISSQSLPGVSVITVTISDYVSVERVKRAFQDIRNYVNDSRGDLPQGINGPVVNDKFGETKAYVIGLVSETGQHSYRQLESLGNRIKDKIQAMDYVGEFELMGVQDEKIYIDISMDYFTNLSINPHEVYNAIDSQNIQIAQPYLNVDDKHVLLEVTGPYKNLDQIRDTIVHTDSDGKIYRIKDLDAHVYHGYEDPVVFKSKVNSKKSIIIVFAMKRGQNIVEWGDKINKAIDEIAEDLPEGLSLVELSNQPDNVDAAVQNFMVNFYEAIIIVLLVLGVGMGLKNAAVVTVAVPLIMIATFAMMGVFDMELQQMSINALIISLGMVVDNAIVITDNVDRYIEMGYDKLNAAIKGAIEVKIALFSGTLTTIAAFLPLALMPGNTGEYIASLPQVISIALVISYIVAMFVSPAAAAYFLPSKEQREAKAREKKKEQKSTYEDTLRKYYYPLIDFTQNHKKLVVLILLGLFIGSLVVTAVFIPLSFFPADERAQFVINVTLPNGWDVSGTEKIVQKLENKLEEMKTVKSKDGKHTLVKDYVAYIGGGGPRFYISIAPQPNQTNTAQFMVVTPNKKVTNETIDTFNVFAKEEVSGALIETIKLETGPSVGAPIQVQIAGTEIETLKQYAHEVEKLMEKNPGVESFSDNFGMDSEKLVINIDQEKAKMLGLTSQDIATGMYVGVEGYPISKLKAPERQIDLVLRVPVSERKNLNNIKSMIFTSSKTGIKHRLDSFAKVSFETQTSEIDRYQQLRTITVSAYIKDNYVSSQVLKELTPQIAKIKMEPGYKVTYGGEQDKSSKAYSDLGVLAIFALFLLLMILSFQFKSLRIGLAIYLAIPLAFIGATAGMWIMRQPLGFMSALGLISLAGVVVNNAIVMIGFIQDNMRQGKDLLVSIKEAGVIRFRPIMLTTLSTLGGLLPLALFGGVLFTPMCWVIIFGLSFSTMLTLLVIPMFFVMFGGARDTERHIKDELEYEQELRNQPSEG